MEDKESPDVETPTPTSRRKVSSNRRALDSTAVRPEVKEEVRRRSRETEVK